MRENVDGKNPTDENRETQENEEFRAAPAPTRQWRAFISAKAKAAMKKKKCL